MTDERASTDVLVVDDEDALVQLIRVHLEAAGHGVRTASDGVAALAALRERAPDVLVLDVVMPRMDGWHVLDALAADPRLADVPIVMLTALSGERDVIRAHLTGAVGYVTKPFQRPELLAAVDEALTPSSEAGRRARREQVRGFLTRLAELDAGRQGEGRAVRWSGIEPPRPRPEPPPPPDAELTPRQRQVAALLGEGHGVREIATMLGTSRTNVYAARARVARRLGIEPHEVAATARRLRLHAEVDPSSADPA